MSDQRANANGLLTSQLSRRTLLKGMAGLAGVALLPRGAQAHGLRAKSSVSLWDYPVPNPYTVYYASYYAGVMLLSLQSQDDGTGALLWVDVQTRQVRGPVPIGNGGGLGRPVLTNDGTIWVAGVDNGLYLVDFATGIPETPLQQQISAGPVPGPAGSVMFVTQGGQVAAFNKAGLLWGCATAPVQSQATAPVLANNLVLTGVDDTLFACDPTTGQQAWMYPAGALINGPLAVDDQNVYFSTQAQKVSAVDLVTGNLKWQWPTSPLGVEISAPAVNGNGVYFFDASGLFHALKNDGTQLWPSIQLSSCITAFPIYIEDGVAYVSAFNDTGDAPSALWAVDLSTQQALSQTTPGAYFSGVENGVAYYIHNGFGNVGATNFAGQLHQFFCESELMVEDYMASTGGYQGNTTSYRTHLQMLDDNFNPRVDKAVKVWASGPATLTSGGISYNIDDSGTNNAYLQTDGAGELSLVVTATDLSCPALYIWSNFMDQNECLVIYPDHDSLGTLSQVNGSQLSSATCYDGSSMLPSGYQSAGDLASTVTGTMAGGPALAMARVRRQLSETAKRLPRRPQRPPKPPGSPPTLSENDRYVAYPGSSPNLVYQPQIGATDRPYGTPTVPNWTTVFNGAEVSYSVNTSPQLAVNSAGLGIDDLLKNVVHGAEQVAKIVYTTVDNIVQAVLETAENSYAITITALEHAVAVVAATLKTVIGDIKKAIQWLSYLFNWDDILATKDTIKTAVTGGFANLKSWINLQVTNNYVTLHAGLQGLNMKSSLSQGQQQIGSGSFGSQQPNNNDPQQLYGMGGGKSYTKAHYLTSKVSANANQGNVGLNTVGLLGSSDDAFVTAVETFFTNAQATLEGNSAFQAIPADLKATFSNFSTLLTDPSQFVTHSFSDIIQLMSDLAASLVAFTDAVIEGLLQLLLQVIDGMLSAFQTTIQIPVVSEFWQLISKDPLTVLDLVALMVAVPATIISKAIDGGLSQQRIGVASIPPQKIALFTAQGLQGFMLPTGDALGSALGPVYGKIVTVLGVVVFGLAFPSDLATNTSFTYAFYSLKLFPTVLSLYNFAATSSVVSIVLKAVIRGLICGHGFIMLGLSIAFGVAGESGFSGPIKMVENSFATFPSIGRPLAVGPPAEPNRLGLAALDAVGIFTGLFIGVVNTDG